MFKYLNKLYQSVSIISQLKHTNEFLSLIQDKVKRYYILKHLATKMWGTLLYKHLTIQ